MPLEGIEQPHHIYLTGALRLRAYDGNYSVALPWYQDEPVRRNSEGVTDPARVPGAEYVSRKLNGLSSAGELYFIEVLRDGEFVPIGDVTLKEDNPPISIGVAEYRGKGVGTSVMRAIVERARAVGLKRIYNTGACEHNVASQKMLEAAGFTCVERHHGQARVVYEIDLSSRHAPTLADELSETA